MEQDTEPVIEDLTALDFQPPCEYGEAWRFTACGRPADWLVLKKNPICVHDVDFYICDPCWGSRNSTGWVSCQVCRTGYAPCMGDILRMERIR